MQMIGRAQNVNQIAWNVMDLAKIIVLSVTIQFRISNIWQATIPAIVHALNNVFIALLILSSNLIY